MAAADRRTPAACALGMQPTGRAPASLLRLQQQQLHARRRGACDAHYKRLGEATERRLAPFWTRAESGKLLIPKRPTGSGGWNISPVVFGDRVPRRRARG